MKNLAAAEAVLTHAIESRAFPAAAYGVFLQGEMQALGAAGNFTFEAASPPVSPETVFDLASVSKVLGTTAMAMMLFDRGQLQLDAPIADTLPAFSEGQAGTARHRVTAAMLLAHSSGLPAYARLFEHCRTSESIIDACLHMPLEAAPGERAVYSDIGFILLGHLLETLAGEPLDVFCAREVFAPLEMHSTTYRPARATRASIPPTSIGDLLRHGIIQGEVHDQNCQAMGGVAGHAGLFSSAADCLRFAASMLRGGDALFRSGTVERFTTRCALPPGTTRALGWDTPSTPSSSGQFFSPRSAGHLGYTGTSLWLDFEKQLAVVLLTNRTYPGTQPESVSKQIAEVRPAFHDAVLRELELAGPAD